MNKIAVCSWPDGQSRDVVVIKDDGESAKIIWNGKVDKVVIGFDEVVPSEWLRYIKVKHRVLNQKLQNPQD